MSVPFSAKMAALLAKAAPEQIYSYKPGKLISVGSYSLSLTFLLYGASFADWSWSASNSIYKEESEEVRKDAKWYENASLLFFGRSAGSILLAVIPFTLSIAALYIPTRIVTKLHYIPDKIPRCKVTTRTLLNGEKSKIIPLRDLTRNANTRAFTGVGAQGVDDRASFSFFLYDKNASFLNKFYIVNRSGHFWGSDGRVMDALFGGESISQLELKDFKNQKPQAANNKPELERMIQEQIARPRLNNSADIKNIILKSKTTSRKDNAEPKQS